MIELLHGAAQHLLSKALVAFDFKIHSFPAHAMAALMGSALGHHVLDLHFVIWKGILLR